MLPQGFPERMLHLLGEAEFAECAQAPAGWRFSPVLRGAGPVGAERLLRLRGQPPRPAPVA